MTRAPKARKRLNKSGKSKGGRPVALALEPAESDEPTLGLDDVAKSEIAQDGGKRLTIRDLLPRLGGIMCTTKETAAVLGVSEPTLFAFFKREPEAKRLFEDGKQEGKTSLRRSQFALADKNATMAIFLGMNYLDQKDKRELGGPKGQPLFPGEIPIKSLTEEQLVELKRRLSGVK